MVDKRLSGGETTSNNLWYQLIRRTTHVRMVRGADRLWCFATTCSTIELTGNSTTSALFTPATSTLTVARTRASVIRRLLTDLELVTFASTAAKPCFGLRRRGTLHCFIAFFGGPSRSPIWMRGFATFPNGTTSNKTCCPVISFGRSRSMKVLLQCVRGMS